MRALEKDQIILDTRSNRIKLRDFKLIPSNGAGEIDLLAKFSLGSPTMQYHNQIYDLVLDFASGAAFMDHSVFIGN